MVRMGHLARWRSDLGTASPAGDAVGAELLARWAEPHRHYHTRAHLASVLSTVDAYADAAEDARAVRLAAWLHDAVYDPHAAGPANEEASAQLAYRLLRRLDDPAAGEVARLVRLTAGHDPAPGDRNGALLCDADLAVLAGPAAEYDAYAYAVRREYAHVPDDAFRAGRAAVLRHLLDLPELYRVPALRARWEGAARANLRRELATLSPDR